MGFSRQEYWSGLSFPFPGNLPNPEIKPESLKSPALAGGFFTTEPPDKPWLFTVNGFTWFSFFSSHFWGRGEKENTIQIPTVFSAVSCRHRSVNVLCCMALGDFLFIKSLLRAKDCTENLRHDVKLVLWLPSMQMRKGFREFMSPVSHRWWVTHLRLRFRFDSEISVWGPGESHSRPPVCLEEEKVNVCEWIIKCCFRKTALRDFTSGARTISRGLQCFPAGLSVSVWTSQEAGSRALSTPLLSPHRLVVGEGGFSLGLWRQPRRFWGTKSGNLWPVLEGLMLKLKLRYFGHLMQRANSMEKTLMLEKDWRQQKWVAGDEMVR